MQATLVVAEAVRDAAGRTGGGPCSPARTFTTALTAALGALAPGARPKAELVRRDDRLELRWPRATVTVHTVAGHDEITLSVLAWFAAREAQRIADGEIDGALLVAAAPDALWGAGRRGTALLTGDGTWSTSDLHEHAHRSHRAWPRDPDPPAWVPARLRTTPALQVPAGPGWLAAAAGVTPDSAECFHWPARTTGGSTSVRRAA